MVVEAVFSWPGIGLLTYNAIKTLDYPVIQGVFLLCERGGDRVQPGGRHHVRLHRPAGAGGLRWRPTSPGGAPLARGRWSGRRRRASIAAHWRTFRRNRQGMIGLARAARVRRGRDRRADAGDRGVDRARRPPAARSRRRPRSPTRSGTDNFGRSVLVADDRRRADLAARGLHRGVRRDADRRSVGDHRRATSAARRSTPR